MENKIKEIEQSGIVDKLTGLAEKVVGKLGRPPVLMEVCGTHTTAIARAGIKTLLGEYVDLRSGPGCPVCVTDQSDIDKIIALSRLPNVIIATFGDMIRVPGTTSTLERERARGARVEVLYSPMDALDLADSYPSKQVVFLGVGFETTTPAIAVTLVEARKRGINNYSVLAMHKVVPPAMRTLLDDQSLGIDGFLLPGHVSAIVGRKAFDFIAAEYGLPSVIAGFEAADVLAGIYLLLYQIMHSRKQTLNGYTRLVTEEGNSRAGEIVKECFEPADVLWRGFGLIPASGLRLNEACANYDAMNRFTVDVPESGLPEGCSCGEILKGKLKPAECPLFGFRCTPFDPVGPCMVSSEGACAASYQYERVG
jgi:hydrogenase expression/formation protein HypD